LIGTEDNKAILIDLGTKKIVNNKTKKTFTVSKKKNDD